MKNSENDPTANYTTLKKVKSMKNSQNFPEIVRKSCKNCAKLHRTSGSCVDPNVLNIYAPRQPDDTACPLFTETTHEHFPNITSLENTDD